MITEREQAAGQHAIVQALFRLQTAIDERDWDTVRNTFTADAIGYSSRGVECILATMHRHLDGVGPTQHLLGNVQVTVEEDTARTMSYARVYHVGAGEKDGAFFECMGEYDDCWEHTADGWRLTRREFDMRIQLGDIGVLKPS